MTIIDCCISFENDQTIFGCVESCGYAPASVKSKMANSITVLQVEPYSCPSSILFQFSWGKVWSKTIHKLSMQLLKPSPTVCATSILVMGSVNSF